MNNKYKYINRIKYTTKSYIYILFVYHICHDNTTFRIMETTDRLVFFIYIYIYIYGSN